MILTCDRKIIDIYFGIVIIEVFIEPIITTIVIVIFPTITTTVFLYVICYQIWMNECDDVLIELLKTIPTDLIITIVITTFIGRFFSHSQRSFFSRTLLNITKFDMISSIQTIKGTILLHRFPFCII